MKNGFTLIELLVVIGILVLLLSITILAINPARQFAEANNTKRRSDIVEISNAIYQNEVDNKGKFYVNGSPFTIPLTPGYISNTGIDICSALIPTYIPSLPEDPSLGSSVITSCSSYNTGYQVFLDSSGRLTVAAPSAQNGESISVSR